MGFTTRVKSEASEKKPFNFALFWDKYGTFFILAIIVAIFGSLSPEYFLTTNNITQIFVQSSVTVLIGMGEFFAILVAGIDLSVGAILALSGMVTAKLMLAGVDPFLAAMIGGVLVGGALGAINGCLVNWTGLHPFIITLGTNAIFRGITLVISDANSVYGFSFDFVSFFAASVIGIPVPVIFSLIVPKPWAGLVSQLIQRHVQSQAFTLHTMNYIKNILLNQKTGMVPRKIGSHFLSKGKVN